MPELKAIDPTSFQARLSDGFVSTLRARQFYFDPPEFRRNLNAAIEALRSFTWVIQKACKGATGFDTWYQQRQQEMRNDPLLRWLVDSRNEVVKQGDLKGHSTARIRIHCGWYTARSVETNVSPETKPHEFAQALAPLVPDFARIEEGVLRVDRRWVHELAPDHEVTEILEHCCRQLLSLHDALAEQFDLPKSSELEAASEKLLKARWDYTGCWMKLQNGELGWSGTIPQEITPDDPKVAEARYGPSLEDEPDLQLHTPLQKSCGLIFRTALTVLRVDGHALPFAFIIDTKGALHQHALKMHDRAEKHMVIRLIAEHARRLNAKSVIIVSEGWRAPGTPGPLHAAHRKDRTEVLLVHGVDHEGECFSILQPFGRIEGQISISSKPHTETALLNLMRPIYEAITKKA